MSDPCDVISRICDDAEPDKLSRIAAVLGMDAVEAQRDALRGAARVLADFANTAPGRLPSRVQEALTVVDGAAPSAGQTLPAETPVLAQLGTGSGAGAQSDSGADSGHFARAVQSEGSTGEAPGAAMTDLPRHRFWGAGEPDCPPDIKAPNGELCTMRCKVCGDGWRKSHNICFAALATVEAKEKTR